MSNETRKFAGLEALQTFLEGCKTLFANITHKHTLDDVTDYVVDSELSQESNNPVQNSTITAEFNAIKDSKAAKDHSHAISDVTDLQTTLDGKANAFTAAYINIESNATVVTEEAIAQMMEEIENGAY